MKIDTWYNVEYIIMHLCMPIFIYMKWRHCLWCCQLYKYIKIWNWNIVLILELQISWNKTCIYTMNYSFLLFCTENLGKCDLKISRYWFRLRCGSFVFMIKVLESRRKVVKGVFCKMYLITIPLIEFLTVFKCTKVMCWVLQIFFFLYYIIL